MKTIIAIIIIFTHQFFFYGTELPLAKQSIMQYTAGTSQLLINTSINNQRL